MLQHLRNNIGKTAAVGAAVGVGLAAAFFAPTKKEAGAEAKDAAESIPIAFKQEGASPFSLPLKEPSAAERTQFSSGMTALRTLAERALNSEPPAPAAEQVFLPKLAALERAAQTLLLDVSSAGNQEIYTAARQAFRSGWEEYCQAARLPFAAAQGVLAREAINHAGFFFELAVDGFRAPDPEYSDSLSHLTLAMTADDLFGNEFARPSLFNTQLRIIEALPAYTEVTIIFPSGEGDLMSSLLQTVLPKTVCERISLIPLSPFEFNVYIQDPVEGAPSAGLLPLRLPIMEHFQNNDFPKDYERFRTFTLFVEELYSYGLGFFELPVYFEGGNLFCARDKDGKRTALSGSSDYIRSKAHYELAGLELSEDQYLEYLKRALRCETALILGMRDKQGNFLPQPYEMFHLDQSINFIADGAYGLVALVENNHNPLALYEDYLEIRSLFETKWQNRLGNHLRFEAVSGINLAGYTLDKAEISAEELMQFSDDLALMQAYTSYTKDLLWEFQRAPQIKSYLKNLENTLSNFSPVFLTAPYRNLEDRKTPANGIPYFNAETRQPAYILPTYDIPNAAPEIAYDQINIRTLTERGYSVTPLADEAYHWAGGLHCLTSRYTWSFTKHLPVEAAVQAAYPVD